MTTSPEIAGKEDDDREQLQSSDDHEQTEVDLQSRVEEGEVAHRCSVTEGGPGVGEHAEGRGKTGLHIEALKREHKSGEQEDAHKGKEKYSDSRDNRR